MKPWHPKFPTLSRDEIELRAKRNLALWSVLFNGTAQVPFAEFWSWPLRMGLEFFEAHALYGAEVEKVQAKAEADAARRLDEAQGTAPKPWWESSLGLRR